MNKINELVNANSIATLCILADILAYTNILQTFLQGARLNFLELPGKVDKLLKCLRLKASNPELPETSNFAGLQDFFDIASNSAEA